MTDYGALVAADRYARWVDAGADSCIVKFETSNSVLYDRISHSLMAPRETCMRAIKATGLILGAGNIVGPSDQTISDLADDVLHAIEIEPDFVSSAPFIPNEDTSQEDLGNGDVDLTLNKWQSGALRSRKSGRMGS